MMWNHHHRVLDDQIKGNEIDGVHSKHGIDEKILVGKCEWKRLLGRHICGQENNIKSNFRNGVRAWTAS